MIKTLHMDQTVTGSNWGRCGTHKTDDARSGLEVTHVTDKLKELILYVSDKCEGEDDFGSTKLNKILFYADFTTYARTGKAITGEEYQKLDHGPAPRRLIPAIEALKAAEHLAEKTRSYFGFPQRWFVALRDPDLSEFTAQEVAIVDEVIDCLRGKNAATVSQMSHTFVGWKLAAIGDTIPYHTVWLSDREPSEADLEYGAVVARKHGLA